MRGKRFGRPSHTTVVAYLALFAALGTGGAYAANTIGSSDIIDESILSQDIKNGEVKSPDLAGAAVTNGKLGTNSVGTGKVADNSLAAVDLAPGSVGASEVAANSLQGGDIQDQSGVDTCVSTTRLGQLCVRAENQDRSWEQALAHCANLDLRLPSLSEALELVQTHDIPNVDDIELFWTGDSWINGPTQFASVASDDGARGWANTLPDNTFETVCVTTPTN